MESASYPINLPPMRRELVGWFRCNAKPLAEAYEGSLRLLDDSGFPGRVHFIAHAVRDIADRLPFVLDQDMSSSRVQYENEMDKIEPEWPNIHKIEETDNKTPIQDTITIKYELAIRLNTLVEAHRERRQRPSNYELLFRLLMRNEPTQATVNERLVSDFKKIRKWFMDRTHLRSKEAPEVDEDKLQAQFMKFESMLHSFVGHFFTGTAKIDEILHQANQ